MPPPEATAEQKGRIESRQDITRRREDLRLVKLGNDKQAIAKAKSALDQRRRGVCDLLVIEAREKYFAEANSLRADGQSTDELRERSRHARPTSVATTPCSTSLA